MPITPPLMDNPAFDDWSQQTTDEVNRSTESVVILTPTEGAVFPDPPRLGQMFYLTVAMTGRTIGWHIYTGGAINDWQRITTT